MKKVILTENAPAPIGPYSQAILAGNTLYVSGQIPVEPETKQVMENISAILKQAGYSFNDVVKTTILLADIATFAVVNEIYGSYFANDGAPARETYQVAKLPKGVNVEISCIAVK